MLPWFIRLTSHWQNKFRRPTETWVCCVFACGVSHPSAQVFVLSEWSALQLELRHDSVSCSVLGRPRGYTHVTEHEEQLLRRWTAQGKAAAEIAELLDRDVFTVARRMQRAGMVGRGATAGRPRALSSDDEKRVVRTAERLIQQADGEWQVTADLIKTALKLKCCARVVREALHRHGVCFHPMRQKPIRTKEDVQQRIAFAREHSQKPVSFWVHKVDAYIDNKFFPTYLNAKARAYARKLRPRGTCRATRDGLGRGHSVGISAEKVLSCHIVDDIWNKNSAAVVYRDVLVPALRQARPGKSKFLILEDNDPTGYKSKLAQDTKKELGVTVLELPKRSPDLNPLDYAFWSEVNGRLRSQEAEFPDKFTETRCQFAKRLRRTVLGVPPATLCAMVSNMKRRCGSSTHMEWEHRF